MKVDYEKYFVLGHMPAGFHMPGYDIFDHVWMSLQIQDWFTDEKYYVDEDGNDL
jgi:hypothetical protein